MDIHDLKAFLFRKLLFMNNTNSMIVVLMKRNKVNALNLSYIAGLKLMIKLKINLMTQRHLSLIHIMELDIE